MRGGSHLTGQTSEIKCETRNDKLTDQLQRSLVVNRDSAIDSNSIETRDSHQACTNDLPVPLELYMRVRGVTGDGEGIRRLMLNVRASRLSSTVTQLSEEGGPDVVLVE